MKTLEEKAKGYANEQMRCYKCSDTQAPCRENKCVDWHRCFKGYKQGAGESIRWRDVNVELPEAKKKGISDNVLLKYSVNGLIHDNTYECCVEAFYCHDTEMWHSLMPLDDENLKLTPIAWRPL